MALAASVVIPQYNGRRFLPALMESLAAQTRTDFEIIVVDDGSTDDGIDYLRQHWPNVRVQKNAANVGFAGSVNAGIRATAAPFVALLNNDTHVDRNWMAEALAAFDEADVGAVASLSLLAEPPHRIDTAGDVYTVAGGAVKRLHGMPREAVNGLSRDAFSASGVSAFFRRAALDQVGLLDEAFESYYEDVDLGFRLQWAGWRCVLAPRSVCFHHLSSSYGSTSWRYRYNSSRNAEIVWWSHMPRRLRRRYLHVHLFCLLLQGLAETRRGQGRAWLAGKWRALRMGGVIREKRRQDERLARIDDRALLARLQRDWFNVHVGPKIRKVAHALGLAPRDADSAEAAGSSTSQGGAGP